MPLTPFGVPLWWTRCARWLIQPPIPRSHLHTLWTTVDTIQLVARPVDCWWSLELERNITHDIYLRFFLKWPHFPTGKQEISAFLTCFPFCLISWRSTNLVAQSPPLLSLLCHAACATVYRHPGDADTWIHFPPRDHRPEPDKTVKHWMVSEVFPGANKCLNFGGNQEKRTCPSTVPKAKVSCNGSIVSVMNGEGEMMVDWYRTVLLLISHTWKTKV